MRNLALNRPALQSSTSHWSSDPDPALDARIANDGDVETDKYFHTESQASPWWQVDLGGVFAISRVKIFNRFERPDRLRRFSVLRSCDGDAWLLCARRGGDDDFDVVSLDMPEDALARFVRVRLDGVGMLHFRQCEVYGAEPDAETFARASRRDRSRLELRTTPPPGRSGACVEVGGFSVFVDDAYGGGVQAALRGGYYEGWEREAAVRFLRPADRVLEAGTAVGVVAMTAASIVGAEAVLTFDGNPQMIEDARRNFACNGFDGLQAVHGLLANRRRFRPGATRRFGVSEEFWASRLADDACDGFARYVDVSVRCLEDELSRFDANVLICDIEGGEVELLGEAELSRLRLIVLETHYWACGETATDALIRRLIEAGFDLHLHASRDGVVVLRRPSP